MKVCRSEIQQTKTNYYLDVKSLWHINNQLDLCLIKLMSHDTHCDGHIGGNKIDEDFSLFSRPPTLSLTILASQQTFITHLINKQGSIWSKLIIQAVKMVTVCFEEYFNILENLLICFLFQKSKEKLNMNLVSVALVILAQHKDCKQGETASMALSQGKKHTFQHL